MAIETTSSNSLSFSARLAQRRIGLNGIRNGALYRVGRSHAPSDSVKGAHLCCFGATPNGAVPLGRPRLRIGAKFNRRARVFEPLEALNNREYVSDIDDRVDLRTRRQVRFHVRHRHVGRVAR